MMDQPSKISQVQSLAGNSFITRTTEVTASPQDLTSELETAINGVNISTEVTSSSEEYTLEMDSEMLVTITNRFNHPVWQMTN
jgi:hypothetical protein